MKKYFDSTGYKIGDTVCRVHVSAHDNSRSYKFLEILRKTPKTGVITVKVVNHKAETVTTEQFNSRGRRMKRSWQGSRYYGPTVFLLSEEEGRREEALHLAQKKYKQELYELLSTVEMLSNADNGIDSAKGRATLAANLREAATILEAFHAGD